MELDLIEQRKTDSYKLIIGDLVKVQTSSLYRENLFLILSVIDIFPNRTYIGEILGIEGFNRGNEGAVFRKLYKHDSFRFKFSNLKTGDKIKFHHNNVII